MGRRPLGPVQYTEVTLHGCSAGRQPPAVLLIRQRARLHRGRPGPRALDARAPAPGLRLVRDCMPSAGTAPFDSGHERGPQWAVLVLQAVYIGGCLSGAELCFRDLHCRSLDVNASLQQQQLSEAADDAVSSLAPVPAAAKALFRDEDAIPATQQSAGSADTATQQAAEQAAEVLPASAAAAEAEAGWEDDNWQQDAGKPFDITS